MARAARALLAIPLRARGPDFTARARIVRTLTRVRQLAHKSLVHQANVDLGFEYIGRQLDLRHFVASAVHHGKLHRHNSLA